MVTTSRTLGGLPVTSYPNFCMRTIQDPLTSGLGLARTISRNSTLKVGVTTYIILQKKPGVDFVSPKGSLQLTSCNPLTVRASLARHD